MTGKAKTTFMAPNAKSPTVVKRSSGSKRGEIARRAGRISGDSRTRKAEEHVRSAMRAIEAEVLAAGRLQELFPKGLTKKQVAERAGINPRSFYTPKLKDLGGEVDRWVIRQNGAGSSDDREAKSPEDDENSTSKARSLSQRYADLRVKWRTVLQDTRDTKLALQQSKSELEAALAENAQLQLENASLAARLAALEKRDTKVIRLPHKKG